MADTYITMLSKVVQSIESTYGLDTTDSKGQKISALGIAEVIEYVKQSISSMSKDDISRKNKAIAKDVILLSYLSQRIKYYDYVKLNFKKYPAIREVAKILLKFTSASRVSQDGKRQIGKLIKLLEELDKKQVKIRAGLAYKYLRIFIIMVLYGNLCNASVIADFIISQFVVRRV